MNLDPTLIGGYVLSAVDVDGQLDVYVVPVDPSLNIFHASIRNGQGSYTAFAQTSPIAVEKADEASALLPPDYSAKAAKAALDQIQERQLLRIEELQNELSFLTNDVVTRTVVIDDMAAALGIDVT